jgi:hypothetical protein
MQLQVEYVLSDDMKNYYQEEKQPTVGKTRHVQVQNFCSN